MTPVDLYCERMSPGLLAEPMNALSNVAFVLAALWIWRSGGSTLGAALLATVGLGSAVFHTWATQLGMVLDVVPILALIAFCGDRALRVTLAWRPRRILTVAGALTVLVLPLWFGVEDPAAAGIAYLPAGLLLWLVWTRFRSRGHPGASWLLVASLAFTGAYTARALDGLLCPWIPMGTHWIWHLLNALSMAAVLRALTPAAPHPRRPPSTGPEA